MIFSPYIFETAYPETFQEASTMSSKSENYALQPAFIGRFYQQHFALLFMPATILDATGKILHWNRYAESSSGYSQKDMVDSLQALLLLPAHNDYPEDLWNMLLTENKDALERFFGKGHTIIKNGTIVIFDMRPQQHIILFGTWRDTTKKSYYFLAVERLDVYDFTVSPNVSLYDVFQALDRKKNAWFGIQQNERYCYLSNEFINALYGDNISMEQLIDASMGQTMSNAAAIDHARTISTLSYSIHGEDNVLNWPHSKAANVSWLQSFPFILPVNGHPVNFSLVRDISMQKEMDATLENLLLSCKIGKKDKKLGEHLSDFASISHVMKITMENIVRAALSLVTVSILGETGTGKTQVARLIHRLSPHGDGPFVYVNCGAIPEELFESNFFGHVKGSFTGAVRDNHGLLAKADNGTLFLDEIAELSPKSQAKLLQVLSEKSYLPVGSTEEKTSKFRLIVATNKNMEDLVRQGLFREDLYYRVNVMSITLPPLRERKEDIPVLINSILRKNSIFCSLSQEELQILKEHSWPGNIRELENVIFHYAVEGNLNFFNPVISSTDISLNTLNQKPASLKMQLEQYEQKIIMENLERHHWNRRKVADELEISRPTLFRKMRQYGLL